MRVKRIDSYTCRDPSRIAVRPIIIDPIPDHGRRRRIDVIGDENAPNVSRGPSRVAVARCPGDLFNNTPKARDAIECASQVTGIATRTKCR